MDSNISDDNVRVGIGEKKSDKSEKSVVTSVKCIVDVRELKIQARELRNLVSSLGSSVKQLVPHMKEHCLLIEETIPDYLEGSSENSTLVLQTCSDGIAQTLAKSSDCVSNLLTDPWAVSSQHSGEIYELQVLRQFNEMEALWRNVGSPSEMICDSAGQEWWIKTFGNMTYTVPWSEFYHVLSKADTVSIESGSDLVKLAEPLIGPLLDFCFDKVVTPYEFNIFLKWFGPIGSIISNVQRMADHGAFFGFMTWEKAESLLIGRPPGTYIIRFSRRSPGDWALDVRSSSVRHPVRHALYERYKSGGVFVLDAVEKYSSIYCAAFRAMAEPSIAKEDVKTGLGKYALYRPYSDFAAYEFSSNICQICMSYRHATTSLVPCLHEMCDECASSWLSTTEHSCPFCRQQVESLIQQSRVQESEFSSRREVLANIDNTNQVEEESGDRLT